MKLKEVKRNRKNKRRLLAVLCILMILAVAMGAACLIKTFLLALMGYKTLVLIGTGCTLAVWFLAVALQNLIEEVNHGGIRGRI